MQDTPEAHYISYFCQIIISDLCENKPIMYKFIKKKKNPSCTKAPILHPNPKVKK